MLGAFAVGKTSLVRQYVYSIFSGKYQTTIGVKIDRKSLLIDGQAIELILWDLAGEEESINVRSSYLRGAAGALLVADGTRGETLEVAFDLKRKLYAEAGQVPVVLLVNKSDLADTWDVERDNLEQIRAQGLALFETSARDGTNVNRAYQALALEICRGADP